VSEGADRHAEGMRGVFGPYYHQSRRWTSKRRRRRRSTSTAVLLTLALASGACGGSDPDATSTASTDDGSQASTTAGSTSTAGSASTSETTTASTSGTTAANGDTATTLPGEPFVGFAQPGDRLIVVGVAHDDTLNVREGPGTDYAVMTSLAPTEPKVVATGEARLLDRSLWYGLDVDSGQGWANASFLAFEGGVDDVTSQVVASIGERPQAETMVDLGMIVAEDRSSSDVDSDVVMVVAPTVGDLGEVTFDVIGLADDSIYGLRLHVFGEPLPGGEGFGLRSVEQTSLCGRGASASGLCA